MRVRVRLGVRVRVEVRGRVRVRVRGAWRRLGGDERGLDGQRARAAHRVDERLLLRVVARMEQQPRGDTLLVRDRGWVSVAVGLLLTLL